TGNKFEFRMLGSAFSVSGPNIILNTITAQALSEFAEQLEAAEDFNGTLNRIIREAIKKHRRIIFNGNNYSEEWVKEASRRGLSNLAATPDSLPCFITEKSINLFSRHKVFTPGEVHSRYEILMEGYCKTMNIEALTLLDIARRDIFPACCAYIKDLTDLASAKKGLGIGAGAAAEEKMIVRLSSLVDALDGKILALEAALEKTRKAEDLQSKARTFREAVLPEMQEIRRYADELESLAGAKYWPMPTYGDLLFRV
ncbi:MAG TPA: glutamine synthetase type III, partial [Clostridiales bacterium]|nr:glutamine synthetase type III [Clostridiales bacterium]